MFFELFWFGKKLNQCFSASIGFWLQTETRKPKPEPENRNSIREKNNLNPKQKTGSQNNEDLHKIYPKIAKINWTWNRKTKTENRKPIHDKKFEPETGNHKSEPENRNPIHKKNFEPETGNRNPIPEKTFFSGSNFFFRNRVSVFKVPVSVSGFRFRVQKNFFTNRVSVFGFRFRFATGNR